MNVDQILAKLLGANYHNFFRDQARRQAGRMFHQSTPASGRNHYGSNNHSAGTSKTRRLMAAKSNRINRQRVKRWKH